MAQNFAKISLGQTFKPQGSTPSNPSNGDMYYDSTRNTMIHYINGNWTDVQSRTDVASAASLTSANFTASAVQSSLIRITGSTAGTIAGMTASSDGKFVVLYNESTALMTIVNNSGTEATAANRILTPGGTPITLSAGQSVLMGYDSSQSNWIALSSPSSSGSGSGSGKNYLSAIVTSQSTTANTGNGNFELGSTTGWNFAFSAITSSLPSTTLPAGLAYANNYYIFTISAGQTASVGATFTNNGQTFTVASTLTSGQTTLYTTGTNDPTGSGTLTHATGTASGNITYSAFARTADPSVITLSAISSGQLAGSYSLSYSKASATSAGDMLLSNAFYIDTEDQAKVMTFKFYYNVNSGAANLNFSGTSSNTFAVYFYDVANGVWIQPAGVYGMTQNSGTGYCTGTFQTASNATQYQMAIVGINASSGAMTMYFDDFTVGPQTAPIGAPITDWVNAGVNTITASGGGAAKGTTSVDKLWWRRVGGNMEVRIEYFQTGSGTAGSGDYLFAIPSVGTIDTTKVSAYSATGTGSTPSSTNIVGSGYAVSAGSSAGNANVSVYDATHVRLFAQMGNSSAITNAGFLGSGVIALSGSNIGYEATFSVPITGWSSNVQISNDTDTRVVAASYTGATASLTSSYSNVTFTTLSTDTHGGYSGATYTIPVSGIYDFGGQLYTSGTASLNATTIVGLSQNGSIVRESDFTYAGAVTGSVGIPFNFGSINCKAGDLIIIQAKSSITLPVITASSTENFLNLARRSGPSVIAATESVNAKYTNTAGTTVTTGLAAIPFANKVFDSHNAFSGSTYTVPVSGKYLVTAKLQLAGVTMSTSQAFTIQVFQNGSVQDSTITPANGGTTFPYSVSITSLLTCLAGDTIQVEAVSSVSAALNTNAYNNNFAITRVGN